MARPRKNVAFAGASPMEAAIAAQSAEPVDQLSSNDSTNDSSINLDNQPIDNSFQQNDVEIKTNNEAANLPAEEISQPASSFTDDELKAIESGWTPKEFYQGDETRWKDAKSWNDRTSERNTLRNLVEEQKVQLALMQKQQADIYRMLQEDKIRNAQTQLSVVEKEREEAIKMADVDKVKKLDEALFNLKGVIYNYNQPNYQQTSSSAAPVEEPIEVKNFKNRNKWFNGTDALSIEKTAYAQALEDNLNRQRNSLSLADKMLYIEQSVNRRFGEQPRNVAPVEMRRTPVINNTGDNIPSYDMLSNDAKTIINDFVRQREFAMRRNKKAFNIGQYRSSYIKKLINDGTIDSRGQLIIDRK